MIYNIKINIVALFKMIKELEGELNRLEQKQPSFFITRIINDRRIVKIKFRIEQLREEVVARKSMKPEEK